MARICMMVFKSGVARIFDNGFQIINGSHINFGLQELHGFLFNIIKMVRIFSMFFKFPHDSHALNGFQLLTDSHYMFGF